MASDDPRLQCSECSARFRKPYHLNRHQLSHEDIRSYQCQFCFSSFVRRDALVRHWRTCELRLVSKVTIPTLPCRKRGRKQNACTRCAQIKKKCSGSHPCINCIEHGQECNFTRSAPSNQSNGLAKEDYAISNELPENTMQHSQTSMQTPTTLTTFNDLFDDCGLLPTINNSHSTGSTGLSANYFSCLSSIGIKGHALDIQDVTWTMADFASFIPSLFPKSSPRGANFDFLVRFTSTHGIADSFSCGDPHERKNVMSSLTYKSKPTPYRLDNVANNRAKTSIASWFERRESHAGEGNSNVQGFALDLIYSIPHMSSKQTASEDSKGLHSLQSKTQEIVCGLKDTICRNKTTESMIIRWDDSVEAACYRFFSPQNLDRLIAAFWFMWYPNWPVFHTPTFITSKKPATLIASLALIAASLTSENDDLEEAMFWIDAVEEWVFSDPELSESIILRTNNESEQDQVEARLDAVRSAYAIVLFLSWEGSDIQMTRSRRSRFSQLICVARTLYFFATPHHVTNYLDPNRQLQMWKTFSLREECIRTAMYVFMLDCAYVMFNNTSPRMVINELKFGLSCPEACFQAVDIDDWIIHTLAWSECQYTREAISLSAATNMVLNNDPTPYEWKILEHTNILNLFALSNTFHNLIFHHKNGPTSKILSQFLSTGLLNWARAWDNRIGNHTDYKVYQLGTFDWRRVGFMRHASEFWRLAMIIYRQSNYMKTSRLDNMLMNGGYAGSAAFSRFDSSDMGQVHKLIVQFQTTSIV